MVWPGLWTGEGLKISICNGFMCSFSLDDAVMFSLPSWRRRTSTSGDDPMPAIIVFGIVYTFARDRPGTCPQLPSRLPQWRRCNTISLHPGLAYRIRSRCPRAFPHPVLNFPPCPRQCRLIIGTVHCNLLLS